MVSFTGAHEMQPTVPTLLTDPANRISTSVKAALEIKGP